MNSDGLNRRAIFSDAAYPSWSPDGQRIVFQRASGLWIIRADGSALRQLTTQLASFPSWSPDGQQIAFDLVFGGIDVVSVDGTGLRQLVPPDSTSYAGAPAWSPDGSMLAFHRLTALVTGSQPPPRIYVMRADGTGVRQISQFTAGQDWTPAWAPDGLRLVFVHDIGGQFDLYVVGADGSGQRQITATGGIQFRPSW
jgi:TolB protein